MDGDMGGLIKEVKESGTALVVVVAGEVTLDATPIFHKSLLDAWARGPAHLIIEMSEVTHIDSAGVGTLVEVCRRVRKAQAKMSLVGMQPLVRSVFEITRLDSFFPIYESTQEALES